MDPVGSLLGPVRNLFLGHEDLVWRKCALSGMSKEGAWRGSLWSDVGISSTERGW